jgi:hypothetical protein
VASAERSPSLGYRRSVLALWARRLQMDMGFQQAYGAALLRRKGTADHWSPLEQIWVAERAYRSGRGFYPWPNTARWCGLL